MSEHASINGSTRRGFLGMGLALTAASVLTPPAMAQDAPAAPSNPPGPSAEPIGRRKLGELEVSAVGLGVQNMSRRYETLVPPRPEMIHITRAAFERGVTFFDAAEAYGPLEVERILGEALEPIRDEVKIATKFGFDVDPDTGQRRGGRNSKPDHIKRVAEAMLKRLRTDRIDLLYQHRVDPEVPIEDVAGAIKELKDQGKVLHWGMCEMGLATLRRAHATLPVTAVQSEYSMLWRGPEQEVLAVCEELGIGFVPWAPLGMAFLTGAIDAQTRFAQGDFRSMTSRVSPERRALNWAIPSGITRCTYVRSPNRSRPVSR